MQFQRSYRKRVWAFHNDQKNLLQSYYSGCFFSLFSSKMLNSDGHFFLKFFSYSRKASAPLPGNVLQKRVRSIVRRNKLFWSHTFVPTYRILASEIIFYWLFYVWKILWWLFSLESVGTPPENIWLDWLGVEKSNFFGYIPIIFILELYP